MGMFSEITTEIVVKKVVDEIALRLDACRNNYVGQELRSLGRFALTLFEWTTPDWARGYADLFKESP